MTRHRTITGFVAVALLAVAATAATMRSHSPGTDGIVVSAGTTMLKDLTVDANKQSAASFDDRWSAMSALTTDTAERGLDVRKVPPQSDYLAKIVMDPQ